MSYTIAFTNFNPVWFISIMGTGISTSILYNFAYPSHWLRTLSVISFGLCSFCLLSSTILFLGKVICDPKRDQLINNLKMNVFLGCYAMGFTSWVTGLHFLCDGGAPIVIYVLWWVGIAMALFTGWGIFFILVKNSKVNIKDMNATILLPIVALTVVASQGGIILPSLTQNLHLSTLILSFLLWANSMGAAFTVTTVYFYRLICHKLPNKQAIFTCFVPIGFLGQGAFCIQLFGVNCKTYFAAISTSQEHQVQGIAIEIISLLTGLFLQSLGFFFTFFAVAAVVSHGLHKFQYGFWAMTFPLGTMSLASLQTYKLIGWQTFRVISAIYGMATVVVTLFCLVGSVYLMIIPSKENTSSGLTKHEIETV